MMYISLNQAAKLSGYSRDYLRLRARQKKLKAVKFGRNWVTKKEWVKVYLQRVEDYYKGEEREKEKILTNVIPVRWVQFAPAPENLPVEEMNPRTKRAIFSKKWLLVFTFLLFLILLMTIRPWQRILSERTIVIDKESKTTYEAGSGPQSQK